MASISVNEVDILIDKASTWGTAVDATSAGRLLHVSNLTVSPAFEEFTSPMIGFDNFIDSVTRLQLGLNVSVTCDTSYGGQWLLILASLLGTATASPAETTGGQGDYAHNFDLASNNNGKFTTLAWTVETDYALEIPSIKWSSVSVQQNNNGVGTVTFQGIGDRVVDNASVVNTYTEIMAETHPTYQAAVLGSTAGTNHYLRLNAQAGAGLTSGENIEILNWGFTLERPMQARYVLRGANSAYTLEPLQLDKSRGEFFFQAAEINDGAINGIVEWLANSQKKAEVFMDGAQIGSGVNTSLKFQFPKLFPAGAMPTGYDVPSANALMQPTFRYQLAKASAAPTGMTGVTNYLRAVTIDTRSTAYA